MALTPITEMAEDYDGWAAHLTSEQFAATVEKIEKINERAARKGLAGTVGIAYRTVTEEETNDFGFKVTKVWHQTTITGDAPKFEGWRFVATLDYDPNAGLIVRTFPGVESVDREGLREGWCDHCKTTRRRAKTYLVRNEETGEQSQVGTSCIKDYTGWAGHVAWLDTTKVREEAFGGGGTWLTEFSPETVLAVAWACVKAYGYTRSGDWSGTSTANQVRTVLYPNPKSQKDKDFAAKIRPLADEATERAGEILAFLRSDDFAGDSEYVRNLKALAAAERVSPRYVGLLASAPQAWARFNEQTLIRKAREDQPSEWIGTAPDKAAGVKGSRITFTGLIESIRFIESDYGVTTLYQLRAEDSGVIVKWFASSQALGDIKGARVTIRGTVKAHEEYKGTKSTVLTRCTLVEADVKEPAPYVIDAPAKKRAAKKATPAPAPVEEAPQEPAPAQEETPAPVVAEEPASDPQTAEESPAGFSAPAESDSTQEAEADFSRPSITDRALNPDLSPLALYEGGSAALIATMASTPEQAEEFRARSNERFRWVRLGDGPAERVTLCDAVDLLGDAYAEGAEWAADLAKDYGFAAARWDGFLLVVGPDGDVPTV